MPEEQDELAVRRFDKAEFAADTNPRDCLKKALSQLDEYEVHSVFVIGVCSDGDQVSWSAGPGLEKLRHVWLVLQQQCLRLIDRMCSS